MFSNLKLKNRILLGYALPISFLISLGCLLYIGAVRRETIDAKVKRSQNTIINMGTVTNSLSTMIRNVRGQVLFPQDNSYEKKYELGLQNFRKAIGELDKLLQDSEQQKQFIIMVTEINSLDKISREVFALVKKGDLAYAKNLTGSLRVNEIDRVQEVILRKELGFLAKVSQQEEYETRSLLALIVIGTGVSAIGSLAIGLWLASDIGRMMDGVADAIATSSVEIATTIDQQERTASQQAAAVSQTSITMEELGASSQTTAQQAQSAAAGARQALKLSEGGTQAVGRTLDGMTALKGKVEAIANQIMHLNEQANQIGTISGLVSELANQTNMLALNAAVEAVRAGDRGKGFAVIANEIRQLADRSKTSASKINNLVADIQAAINLSVKTTNEGTKTVDSGMQLAQGTAEVFSAVADAINSIAVSTQQISLTAQQQALAVEQVVDAMKTINQGAEETAIGISKTKEGTEQLNQASRNLKAVL